MQFHKTSRSKSLRLYGQETIKVSYHRAKFGGHRHCGSEDNDFSMSHHLIRPRYQKAT